MKMAHLSLTFCTTHGVKMNLEDCLPAKGPAKIRFLSIEPLLGPIPRLPLDVIH
jgi:hypothetical protein